MKRPLALTLLALSGAVAAGTVLFWTSQNVQRAEDTLAALHREALYEKQSIRVLRAEWAWLNRPDRLEGLAENVLDITPASAPLPVTEDPAALPEHVAPLPPPARKPTPDALPVSAPAQPEESAP